MSHMILSERRTTIASYLEAAWRAGWHAGKAGATSEGAHDIAVSMGDLLELELFQGGKPPLEVPSPEPRPLEDEAEELAQRMFFASNNQCAECPLPLLAHDLGNAGHEFVERKRSQLELVTS